MLVTAFSTLVVRYEETGRAYHNLTHLKDVFDKLDWAQRALQKSGEVSDLDESEKRRLFDTIEWALWYHDAVYDPKAKNNEERSAQLFLDHAEKFGLPPEMTKAVVNLIMATAHHKDARTLAERIMTDCDLAILGANKSAFDKYHADIRREYSFVQEPLYTQLRTQVMQDFYDQDKIFKTDAFHQAFETSARRNLESVLPKPSGLNAGTPKPQ